MTVKWNILKVMSPTENQLKAGIFGSANLSLTDSDGSILAYFNNITVRKNSKTGEKFLATPRRSFKKDGEERWQNYYALLPLGDDENLHEKQKQRLRAITSEIVRMADSGGSSSYEETEKDEPQVANTNSEPW